MRRSPESMTIAAGAFCSRFAPPLCSPRAYLPARAKATSSSRAALSNWNIARPFKLPGHGNSLGKYPTSSGVKSRGDRAFSSNLAKTGQQDLSSPNVRKSSLVLLVTVVTACLLTGLAIKSRMSPSSDLTLVEKSMATEEERRAKGQEPLPRKFYDYQVASIDRITPSTFVLSVLATNTAREGMKHHYLSVRKDALAQHGPPVRWSWRFPMWSVDIKEPNVQIARHFTPLPPLEELCPSEGSDRRREGDVLTFYVRTFGSGEMSRYLDRLKPGDPVEMRGPHLGFDVNSRLGTAKEVAFLAGGTGISPGLQAAHAVLEAHADSKVTLLWAVRSCAETAGLDKADLLGSDDSSTTRKRNSWFSSWQYKQPAPSLPDPEPFSSPSRQQEETPIVHHINHLKSRYGARLSVKVAVDELSTAFSPADLRRTLQAAPLRSTSSEKGCQLHDQRMQRSACEPEEWQKSCSCQEGAGKRIFMISGPGGFLSKYAGAKEWSDGRERQGKVGGMIGAVLNEYPRMAPSWLVLKL